MLTRRSLIAGGVSFAAMLARTARSQTPELRPIVPGVWFYQGDFPKNGQCNSIVIERQSDLVVVDANSVGGAFALQAVLKRASGKPVGAVLLTHHHGDHLYGSAVWTRAGATTIAHRTMQSELARFEPARWRQQAAHDAQMAALGDAPVPPRQTFDGPVSVLNDGGRRIELHYFGSAHTRDDMLVYLPGERVLCSGDVAISTSLNSFFDSDYRHWPDVLRAASDLGAIHVLPGHGEAGGGEILTGQASFLAALYEAVERGAEKSQTAAEIAAGLRLPADMDLWANRDRLPQQIAQILALKSAAEKQ